jgi:hypothetical protein
VFSPELRERKEATLTWENDFARHPGCHLAVEHGCGRVLADKVMLPAQVAAAMVCPVTVKFAFRQ